MFATGKRLFFLRQTLPMLPMLNWLIFDRNYTLITGGYQRLSAIPMETGNNVAHELLASPAITITQPGYVYIYLSNEETTPVEVYFDDFKVTQAKSAIVQQDDYYSFGLTSTEARRESSTYNRFLFNKGSEILADFSLGVYETVFRILDPSVGRWWQIDPKPSYNLSLYNSMDNNPISNNDPLGDIVNIRYGGFLGIGRKTVTYGDDGKLTQNGQTFAGKVGGYLSKAVNALNTIRQNGGQEGVSKLVNSSNVFTIQRNASGAGTNDGGNKTIPLDGNASNGIGTGGTIVWKPANKVGGPDQDGGTNRPSFVGLAHELGHALSINEGSVNAAPYIDRAFSSQIINQTLGFPKLPTKDDFNAVHFENLIRSGSGLPLRESFARHSSGAGYMRFLIPGTTINSQTGYDYSMPESVRKMFKND